MSDAARKSRLAPAGSTRQPTSLADKLDDLFATVKPPGRSTPYSNREVAAATDGAVSASTLDNLRNGKKDNPTKRTIEALAKFFGVPASYFVDDNTALAADEDRELREILSNADLRVLALKARQLSPASLAQIGEIIDRIQELEQGRRTSPD